jgi:predicted CoA-substrate-specific enzyme activase
MLRHEGDLVGVLRKILDGDRDVGRVVATGQASRALLDAPYRSESECLERAVSHHGHQPDMLLSLGGENFTLYSMKHGSVRSIVSPSKCAAGTGEFLVQQFHRMGMSLEEGIDASYHGREVELATRCSVFCKSDITHKLNKGEHSKSDIAKALIEDLVRKVVRLIDAARWPASAMVLSGGLTLNRAFVEALRRRLSEMKIAILLEDACLEALGASLFASDASEGAARKYGAAIVKPMKANHDHLEPLGEAESLVDYRVNVGHGGRVRDGRSYILGVDAGSTTTKALLWDEEDGSLGASSYLKTCGNPVLATQLCLRELLEQVNGTPIHVIQAAVTGSGRALVSLFLGNCLSFNEIMAHGRSASEEVAGLTTLFEIGGQDSKYTSFLEGVPVDYAMNEGCSAGTGSFLEEVLAQEMSIPVDEISGRAERSQSPLSFGERCSAFIHTDLTSAFQLGANQDDVIAGLVYSIARNYISRIVGTRSIGETLVFQGGVALNRSVALALAALTRQRVVVPAHPELMGCVGSCLLARDRLREGEAERKSYDLGELVAGQMEARSSFQCPACDNRCEIKRIAVKEKVYPFGGLCSKYEHGGPTGAPRSDGEDLFVLREKLMFEEFGPRSVVRPRGRIGLPMVLTTYEYFPFYAKLINELGYDVVPSSFSRAGMAKNGGPICYPCEVAHGAVNDLVERGVDYVFLPYLIEGEKDNGYPYSYMCTVYGAVPGLIKQAFPEMSSKILSPNIGLSSDLAATTERELGSMGRTLGVRREEAGRALRSAWDHYRRFKQRYLSAGRAAAENVTEPTVILAGRPYITCSPEVNMAIPRRIASKGFRVLPVDLLPMGDGERHPRNVWHFTQQMMNAVHHAKKNPNVHLCFVSCYSCLPDACVHHKIREELAGMPFCYLEMDSHTARLGFDTRLDAFLEIIENQRARASKKRFLPAKAGAPERGRPAAERKVTLARFSPGHDCVIDSDGERVPFDDQRVTHISPFPFNPYTSQMLANVYRKRGWNFRMLGDLNREALQHASRLCSGRECLSTAALTGPVCRDIARNGKSDGISVYYNYDQVTPCQDAAWPMEWETFARRLNLRNTVFMASPTKDNKYLGEGDAFAREFLYSIHLGDLFTEAEGTLACIARNANGALEAFKEEAGAVMHVVPKGFRAITETLRRWSKNVSRIPVNRALRDVPKILIFGMACPLFIHRPVTEFLMEHGVIAKTEDFWELLTFTESATVMRYCIKRGLMAPEDQLRVLPLLLSFFGRNQSAGELLGVLKSRAVIAGTEYMTKKLRGIARESGLVYDQHVSYAEIAQAGHEYVSYDAWCGGTTITIGKYLTSLKAGVFDGFVNLSAFNCQPVINAQTILRNVANRSAVPYVSLELEGPWLSENHQRLLEAFAVQAKRWRARADRATS